MFENSGEEPRAVAAVYQRHEFMAERKDALDGWARHVSAIC